jgi:NTP pyrophosphatase (non-canonical NTP hydrolase)
MNDNDPWGEIFYEWKNVKRVKKLNQELYDLLFSSIVYIMQYSNKYNIPIPQKEALMRMAKRIHDLIDEIEPPISDDRIQPAKNKPSDEEEYRAQYSHI